MVKRIGGSERSTGPLRGCASWRSLRLSSNPRRSRSWQVLSPGRVVKAGCRPVAPSVSWLSAWARLAISAAYYALRYQARAASSRPSALRLRCFQFGGQCEAALRGRVLAGGITRHSGSLPNEAFQGTAGKRRLPVRSLRSPAPELQRWASCL